MKSASFFQIGSSPLSARASFPIGFFILGVVIVAAIVCGVWMLTKKLLDYKKSDAYIKKQLERMTTFKDVKKFSEDNRLTPAMSNVLWNMCKSLKVPNINYLIKEPETLEKLFRDYYFIFKNSGATPQDIDTLFNLTFTVEKISAATKNLLSSKQLPLESVVFYLTHESEQFPLYVKINNNDFVGLEVPKFMVNNPNLKPPLLERLRFITKAQNGMTYHFTSRAIRYQTNPDGQILLIIAHSEDFLNQAHRNSKRESIDAECILSPVRLARTEEKSKKSIKNNQDEFVIAQKEYPGKVTNISSGGCCIKTNLPIKEKQYLSVRFPTLEIHEHVIGIIRRTRKLLDESYNLHIQFLDITVESKNKINAYAFKYEI
ncbi:MAG: PilZ domain-containing protein [Treponema sp.]|nr:PilZ domain-containing protein [Treponema sp.]